MKTAASLLSLFLFVSLFISCKKDEQVTEEETIDITPPNINIDFIDAFPTQCSELTRGESFVVKIRLTDSVALGSYSIDIHDNFDHHSHTTEFQECLLDEKKQAVNPFKFTRSYNTIPENSIEYETNVKIEVPEDVDPGDYHFMIQVTDQVGWSSRIGLSIKIK